MTEQGRLAEAHRNNEQCHRLLRWWGFRGFTVGFLTELNAPHRRTLALPLRPLRVGSDLEPRVLDGAVGVACTLGWFRNGRAGLERSRRVFMTAVEAGKLSGIVVQAGLLQDKNGPH